MNAALALVFLLTQDADLQKVQELQQKLRAVVEKVTPAYVFFGNGSGVCISADGYALTNFHVSGDRQGQRVRMPGGKQYLAVTTSNGGGSPRNVPAVVASELHYPATGNALYVFALPDRR